MVKKWKVYLIALITLVMCITTFFGLSTMKAYAFSGTNSSLTEQELYNETNTYNINTSCFNSSGGFNTTTDESRQFTTQYNISYNLTQKNNNQVMDNAQITVLTHGLGSNAGAWSNHYSKDNNDEISFAYDYNSLISQISYTVGGANIYWAKMGGYDSFDLCDITNQTSTTNIYIQSSIINTITDISKHIIVVFDANNSVESNNNIYYQFNYMLSKIIYDVKIANGGILPKVNLVGHSRGGLTNLQYALDHPDLVSSLVSLGTPYFSSTTANLFGEMFMDGPSDGLDDILNPDIYYEYNTRWNQNYNTLYKDINAYAIGSYHSLGSLMEAIDNDCSEKMSEEELMALSSIFYTISITKIVNPLDMSFLSSITKKLDKWFPSSKLIDLSEILLDEIVYDEDIMNVFWYNDILVNLESQLANDNGAVGHPNTGSYLGFNRITRPFVMGDDYVDYEKVSQKNVPVGHNLVARDKLVIAEVINALELGEESLYIAIENQDGTATFVRANGQNINNEFIVPGTINGKTVTEISPFAFSDATNLTEVVLPNSIKKISAYAFAGLEGLTTISFTGSGLPQLEKIGYGSFAGCTNLNKFNFPESGSLALPTSVEFIDCYAFYGTGFSNVSLDTNVYYIGDCAFSNITSLMGITVATNNNNYFARNGVLYNSDGWLMQYPIGKTDTSFNVPATESNVPIRHISQFAFMGENNLTSINLNNVISIDSFAFMGCTSLATFANSINVEYIGPFALDDTTYFLQAQNFVTLGKVFYRYKGTSTVLNSNNFPTGITRISSNAFCYNDYVQEIYLPNQVLDIDNNAFIDCPNLTKITCYNTTLPDIGEYPFVGLHNDFKFYCRKSIIDSINEQHMWNAQKDLMYPIATDVTFVDNEDFSYETVFYYGSVVTLPNPPQLTGYVFKGWERVNSDGDILTPTTWNETVSSATFRAVYEELFKWTLQFKNGGDNIGVLYIYVGDTYSITRTGYTKNGIYTNFTFYSEMDYYNGTDVNYIQNGHQIATFTGWTYNGSEIKQGQWNGKINGQDVSGVLEIYSQWQPVEFDIELNNSIEGSYVKYTTNYFDGYVFPSRSLSGYEFVGWQDNNGKIHKVGELLQPTSDMEFTAIWEEIYTVRVISSNHASFDEIYQGKYGETITLPTLTSGQYYVQKWGTHNAGSVYTITGNTVLNAVWKGVSYTITYANLTFMGQNATVGWDGNTYQGAPTSYEYGTGLDLTRASAYWQGSAPNNSKLVFLGWYTDKTFTSKKIAITPYDTGNKTLYAKWRYDFGYTHRTGTYTIEDDDPYSGYYDTIYIGLNSNNLYQELKNIGIHYLTIEFKIKIREVKDGYQEMSLYVETSPGTNPVWAVEDLDHELPSGATNDYIYYIYHWTFDIDDVHNCNYLYVRYGADGLGSDTWVTDRAYIDVMYSATEDTEEYVQAFTWENSSGVSDSSCTPLENISDDI